MHDEAGELREARQLNSYLQGELERQRGANGELRRAVADLARTFQESLAAAYEAGEAGDLDAIRKITRANQANWQGYLRQIIAAAQRPAPGESTASEETDAD